MPVKNFFILQLELKMKKSKRYIKKQNNKPLINKKVLAKVIRESNICKHAIKELKLAGYGNSGGSAPWEINLVQKLCDWNIISPLRFTDEEWTKNKNPICWHGGLFEHKNNVLAGRYFNTCLLYEHYIDKGWMPKPTRTIDCVEVEISPDNWIMSVDADNTDLLILSCNYSIQWKECSCLKGIRLENVTVELE